MAGIRLVVFTVTAVVIPFRGGVTDITVRSLILLILVRSFVGLVLLELRGDTDTSIVANLGAGITDDVVSRAGFFLVLMVATSTVVTHLRFMLVKVRMVLIESIALKAVLTRVGLVTGLVTGLVSASSEAAGVDRSSGYLVTLSWFVLVLVTVAFGLLMLSAEPFVLAQTVYRVFFRAPISLVEMLMMVLS